MIIATAPSRLSLFGGGTDLPVFYERYGGMVINMGINLYQKIIVEEPVKNPIYDKSINIQEMPQFGSESFYQEFCKEFQIDDIKIKSVYDGILESGLGSSASSAVALVGAMAKYKGYYISHREVAEKAWDIEVNKIGLYGGKQDQYASCYGQMNEIFFNQNGGVFLKQIDRPKANFIAKNILLFYTGSNRTSIKIQEGLKDLTPEKIASLMEIKKIANLAQHYVEYADIVRMGELLNETWKMKKLSNKVSNPKIDDLYEAGMSAGAEGGKLMGSGGGGFMFFVVKPENQKRVIAQMEELGCKHYEFSIDFNGLQTRKT